MEISPFMVEMMDRLNPAYAAKLRAEGRAEGRTGMFRETILGALRTRFGGPIPHPVQDRVNSESDEATLERWFGHALSAASLDDFSQAVS